LAVSKKKKIQKTVIVFKRPYALLVTDFAIVYCTHIFNEFL